MVLRLMPWALWAALMVFSVSTFADLPAEIPQHFNAAGKVTRSAHTTWFSWLLLPLIAAATQALLTVLTLVLPKRPDLFNFPEKDRFLKLPEAYRAEIIPRMQETMDVLSIVMMLVLCSVQVMIWRSAMGHPTKNSLPFFMAGTLVFLPLALWLTSRVNAATEAADKKWKAATAGTDSRNGNPR